MDNVKKDFIAAMHALGISYEDLGIMTHKGSETISRQLSDDGNPRLDTLVGIAQPLGCEIRAMRKEILELLKSDNLEFIRQKSIEYSNRIVSLEERYPLRRTFLHARRPLPMPVLHIATSWMSRLLN